MFTAGSKLSREETVNSPAHTKVKKEVARHNLTDASSGSLGSSLLKSILMSGRVNGSLFGCFKERGARLAALLRVAST